MSYLNLRICERSEQLEALRQEGCGTMNPVGRGEMGGKEMQPVRVDSEALLYSSTKN